VTKKLISVIVPAYNESDCVNELATRLATLFDTEDLYEWEAIIVENGSTDNTWSLLEDIHKTDPRFKIIRLARNFGMDGGLTAGLDFARGDACVFMTADLQDPPEMISDFLRMWEQGYENVYGVLTKRTGTGPLRTFNSKAFYWLASKLTDGRIPRNVSDFRLLDRRAYEAVRSMEERNRFIRGLAAWVGFESIGIPMERPPRFGGESKAYSFHVIELAFKGIFAHSYVPLRLITLLGVTLSISSFLILLGLIVTWLTRGVPFAGFGTIVTLVIFLFGVIAFMIGILSEYVGLIYEEVKGRPNFIVSRTLGIKD
jgi:dolichol-phosphate mannosyltransferase